MVYYAHGLGYNCYLSFHYPSLNNRRGKRLVKDKVAKLFKAGFFHIFGSSTINKVLVFLSAIILVRVLTKQEYGVFSYMWNIFSLILLFSGFGIEAGSLQILSECKNDKERFKDVYRYSIRFGTIVNIGLAAVIIFISYFVPLPIAGSNELLKLVCFLPILMLIYNLQTIYLRTLSENKRFSALSLINTFFVSALTIAGAYIYESKGLIYGRYLAYLVTIVIGVAIIKTPIPVSRHPINILPVDKRDLLKISSIGLVNNGLSHLMYLIDVFVVGLVMTSEVDVAAYKVATQIPNALVFIPAAVVTFIYPYFAEHREDKKLCFYRYKQVTAAMVAANACISAILVIFAPLIIRLVFGSQYLDAVTSFRILGIAYFFSGSFRVIAGNLLATQRKYYFQLFVAITSGILNFTADYFLVSKYGIEGAAVATLAVAVFTSLLNAGYLIRTLKRTDQ